MADKQVLFRIEGKMLEGLDRKIAKDGYSTRNAWFKDLVSSYAGRGGGGARGAARGGAARGGAARAGPARAAKGRAGRAKTARKKAR
jgi:hypothetical protein